MGEQEGEQEEKGGKTERERAEEERRLRDRAIAASSTGVLITDPNLPDNLIVYVNPAFERMTGYAAEEVLGWNCRFLQGEDRDQPALEEVRDAIREERGCRVVLRNYKKDGTPFWNELYVSPAYDDGGRLTNFVGAQNDITERREAEEALRKSEERYRRLVEFSPEAIAVHDGRKLLFINPAGARLFGASAPRGARG